MMPQTMSEKLLYSTVRIEASNSTGTGFFFSFSFPENKFLPILITNKHVVNNNPLETIKFWLHTKNGNEPSDHKIIISLKTEWYFHPEYDLCFCFVAPLFEQSRKELNKDIFYIPIQESHIVDNLQLKELSAIEDIIMVGYPIGLWDQKNNFPLFRRGITSSHPAIDFNKKNIGIVDIACFPGSSGSPILILNENGYSDKKGNIYIGGSRFIFLGILFSGPQYNASGELIIENIPTQQKFSAFTPLMTNLGYYIKAEEILAFKPIIETLRQSK